MARPLKTLGVVVLVLVAVGGVAVVWFFASYPRSVPPRTLVVEATPERVARGAYLGEHVAGCIDCHSRRDFERHAGPVVPGTEGIGGERFDATTGGVPGVLFATNITPAVLGTWTDGELARALTEGVSRDGRAIFPLMPWPNLAGLCEGDLEALIAWLRTLPPKESAVPPSRLDFPTRYLVRTLPRPVTAAPCPEARTEVEEGAYLVRLAGCGDCHTPMERGRPVPGRAFAGGVAFTLPGGAVSRSTNLTPDPETGLGRWDREGFIERFKREALEPPVAVGPGDPQTVMPWRPYGGMTEQDLGAIYAWLRTLKPVVNEVEPFTPAPARSARR